MLIKLIIAVTISIFMLTNALAASNGTINCPGKNKLKKAVPFITNISYIPFPECAYIAYSTKVKYNNQCHKIEKKLHHHFNVSNVSCFWNKTSKNINKPYYRINFMPK